MTQNMPGNCLGIIAWLNVSHKIFGHTTLSKAFKAYVRYHVYETFAWKPVPQSWIIFVPGKNTLLSGDKIDIGVDDQYGLSVESIGGHLIYK